MEPSCTETVQRILKISSCIYENYEWLLNCYVLDYFTDNHWSKLKPSWQTSLDDLDPEEIASLLNYGGTMEGRIWPLSILALKTLLTNLSLPRQTIQLNEPNPYFTKDEKLLKLFWKNVKSKKRHEISVMSKICYKSAKDVDCFYIVDIGSGLGHLSRMLNYGYNLKVCAIEAQEVLTQQAKKIDEDFEKVLRKYYNDPSIINNKTVHVNVKINADIRASDFLKIIKSAFNTPNDNFLFGIVGLHPCGDLGATLLKLYNGCTNARYINIVGCCYMKLSTPTDKFFGATFGFPLSQFCKRNHYNLSYHSREIACHAIENYTDKLLKGESWKLKIHTYRALIEKIITNLHPDLRHSALANVKYTEDLTFKNYCRKAISKLNIDIPETVLGPAQVDLYISQWKNVVVFYSLRLLFAPLVETVVLLDRFMFIKELGGNCSILPVFNTSVSPRNHVLSGIKK